MHYRPFSVVIFVLTGVMVLSCAPEIKAQTADSTAHQRFQLAESYLRGAQYDRAIRLLEDLYASNPGALLFYTKLKEAYETVKRYDEAVALVDSRMNAEGSKVDLLCEKARLLFLKGNDAEAFALWDRAIEENPQNRNVYRLVYESQYSVRLLDQATLTLERARQYLGETSNVDGELGYLYSLSGKHELAMEAYLRLLARNERQINFVRNRLTRFTEQEETLQSSIPVVERAVRTTPLNRAYRELLTWLYLEAKQYQKAYDASRAIDRLEKEDGRFLFAFAQNLASEGAFDVALQAYEEILNRYPNSRSAPDALLGAGVMHEEWARQINEQVLPSDSGGATAPHFTRALEMYREYTERYPNSPQYPEVLRRIGTLQSEVFNDLAAAETTLQAVARQQRIDTESIDEAEFEIGKIAVKRGNLEEARLTFNRVLDRAQAGELAEKARYELALIHFYNGEFDLARSMVDVLDENTSTDVANDAIELRVLLIENLGPDSLNTPLRLYARAHLQNVQNKPGDALRSLDELMAQFSSHALIDDARFLRAGILRDSGRIEEALAGYREFVALYPTSYLVDRSLYYTGQIQEVDLHDKTAALETYTRLLTDYPGSLLAGEVRNRIRILRGDGV